MIDTFRVVCAAISQHDTLPQIKKKKERKEEKKTVWNSYLVFVTCTKPFFFHIEISFCRHYVTAHRCDGAIILHTHTSHLIAIFLYKVDCINFAYWIVVWELETMDFLYDAMFSSSRPPLPPGCAAVIYSHTCVDGWTLWVSRSRTL